MNHTVHIVDIGRLHSSYNPKHTKTNLLLYVTPSLVWRYIDGQKSWDFFFFLLHFINDVNCVFGTGIAIKFYWLRLTKYIIVVLLKKKNIYEHLSRRAHMKQEAIFLAETLEVIERLFIFFFALILFLLGLFGYLCLWFSFYQYFFFFLW